MDKALQSILDWWEDAGVDVPEIRAVPKPRSKPAVKTPQHLPNPKPAGLAPTTPAAPVNSEPLAKSAKTLADLKAVMDTYDAGLLSDQARQMVFARGNPQGHIMVIGEAPGRDEDIQGKPFVGKSGQLLDMVFASIGLTEESFYITNVINWRPPGNRNPKPDEIAMCMPFLHRHIELIDPKIIVIVGGVSLTALTGETGIMKQRGQWKELKVGDKTCPALPIYHPAFLLRQPALKKDAWRDMLALKVRFNKS